MLLEEDQSPVAVTQPFGLAYTPYHRFDHGDALENLLGAEQDVAAEVGPKLLMGHWRLEGGCWALPPLVESGTSASATPKVPVQ